MNGQTTVADALKQCRMQFTELQTLGIDVSALLRDMSRELLETGRPPAARSIEQLAKYRSDFDQLQMTIPRVGAAAPCGAASLTGIQDELESRGLIHATLERLECLAMIQHIEQGEFAPWQPCLDEGTKLREELLSVPTPQARATAEEFLSHQAPLNAVVTLVADGCELTDERWSLLLDSVSAAYGRELSTAIARGKLVLTSGTRA